MKIIQKLPKYPFDYLYLVDILKNYAYPRNKINKMIKNGEIIRVKKGIYNLSPEYGGEIHHPLLANLIYGPSYVSLEYALSYWGLIPERVETITSITNKRNKHFKTPLGIFTYKYLNDRAFHTGVMLIKNKKISFFIASKEKALCDQIARVKNIITKNDISKYLRHDLRIDMEELINFDKNELLLIKKMYKNKSVSLFYSWYNENFQE